MLRHGATYAGHPACCAAALAVLDIYEREDLIRARARARGAARTTRWRRSPTTRPSARCAPGCGFLAAVALAPEALDAGRRRGRASWPRARARPACSCAPLLGGVAVSPPLIVEQEHIDLLAEALRAGLDRV